MLSQMTAGPLIAMEICGDSIVSKFRAFSGPSDVELAKHVSQHSLRARYGEDKIKNAVHCTDLEDDGVLEVFSD
jgi:nucleoside-diphosphate kinase